MRPLAILTGTLAALAIFALCEAVHAVGMDPFEAPASIGASNPAALAMDGAEQGAGE